MLRHPAGEALTGNECIQLDIHKQGRCLNNLFRQLQLWQYKLDNNNYPKIAGYYNVTVTAEYKSVTYTFQSEITYEDISVTKVDENISPYVIYDGNDYIDFSAFPIIRHKIHMLLSTAFIYWIPQNQKE